MDHASLSDYVAAVEYVDADGEIQVVEDPDELRVAAGSLGLLGVLLSVTLRVREMSYAKWQPQIVDVPLEEYIPRPGSPLPAGLLSQLEVSRHRTTE